PFTTSSNRAQCHDSSASRNITADADNNRGKSEPTDKRILIQHYTTKGNGRTRSRRGNEPDASDWDKKTAQCGGRSHQSKNPGILLRLGERQRSQVNRCRRESRMGDTEPRLGGNGAGSSQSQLSAAKKPTGFVRCCASRGSGIDQSWKKG